MTSSAGGALSSSREPGGLSWLTGFEIFQTILQAGGAIYTDDCYYYITVDETMFKENRATDVCGGPMWVATSDQFRAHLELGKDCAFWNNRSPIGADSSCAKDPQHVDDSSVYCDDSSVFGNGTMTISPASSICHNNGQGDDSERL